MQQRRTQTVRNDSHSRASGARTPARKPATRSAAEQVRPGIRRAPASRAVVPAGRSAQRPAARGGATARPATARPATARPTSTRPASTRPAARRPAGARPASGGNGRSPRRRIVGLVVLVVIIALLWYLLDTLITLGVGTPRFYNVSVNGVSLRGYTREEGFALFEELEEEWANRSYELYYGDSTWTFTPATIDAQLNEETVLERAWNFGRVGSISYRKHVIKSLNDEPYAFESDISYDEEKLEAFIASIREVTDTDPVDAVIAAEGSGPRVITESRNGASLKEDETRELLRNLLLYGSQNARVELPVEVIEPSITSEDAQASLGDGTPIAEYITSIDGSTSNRKHNVRTALSRFSGLKVDPGEVISFNEVALERTLANGYREGIEYSEGESTTGIGGGTCQASSTLYGALLEAGVTIVERYNHSMTVGYCQPSMDAAVTDTGSKDLVFRNDSEAPIYIYTSVSTTQAIVRIYGLRPAYRYEFRSVVLEDDIAPTEETVRVDTTGEYATYTDEKVLVTEGKTGRRSELWRDSYDWETGELVDTLQISSDYYTPGKNIYYVGTQQRLTAMPSATSTTPNTNSW